MKRLISLLILFSLVCFGCGNIKDGTKKEYYKNGKVKSVTNYKNFRKEGSYKENHSNGKIKVEANFRRGKLYGMTRAYDKEGI